MKNKSMKQSDLRPTEDHPRLGQWAFEEAQHIPRGQYWATHCLDDQTIADEAIVNNSSTYVRGRVAQSYHDQIHLRHWHKAIKG